MITKDNLKEVLEILGFTRQENKKADSTKQELYTKTLHSHIMQVDFTKQRLIYPQGIKINDATTSNFSHPENFVVFECVHRLLEKGYKPESLELEPKWALGREQKGGKADILVRDKENAPYLLIECKSAGNEFNKEWGRMQIDGGQLFSYFQQERAVKFLCLYTSDLESFSTTNPSNANTNNTTIQSSDSTNIANPHKQKQKEIQITYKSYIINLNDNEEHLKITKTKGYKDAPSNIELVRVWKDAYNAEMQENGIFEKEIQSYGIALLKPSFESLKPMRLSEIQSKRHEWASILRANAVGDRVLALNRLMNLFLCKITDEQENKNDLQFNWNGYTRDSAFDLVDRLQKLYKIGMEKYLNQTITYHSKDSINQAFSPDFSDTVIREKIQNIFTESKFFSNGDFDFIEVYNEALFKKNFKILLPIVQSLQNIGFTKNVDSNILGDYFESYIHDMPQQEGQYFTPVPLVNFIIHSLPVLKDSKVLDFSCGAGHFLTQYAELNKAYKRAEFLGVDKDQRLAKIAKIASFMHGVGMDIYSYDSLRIASQVNNEAKEYSQDIKDSSFNVLISNPPYSVDGFLGTLDEASKQSYELFNKDINIESNNAIECFFIEKASKALQSNGLLALVLPNSLINKDGIYKATRELLLRDFYIIAIVSLGNQTFFKTGTNPIILFALRKERVAPTITTQTDIYKDSIRFILDSKLSVALKAYKGLLPLLQSYCTFQGFDCADYLAFLQSDLKEDSSLYKHELFKEYKSVYKELESKERADYEKKSDKYKQKNLFAPSISTSQFIREKECEKLLYFCYCIDSTPLIIKAPSDNKEQKKFLGYEWSNAKGKQGIVYLNADSISDIKTPLYNPKNRVDFKKLSFYILQEYCKRLDSSFLDSTVLDSVIYGDEVQDVERNEVSKNTETAIPKDLVPYIVKARLIDMLDFTRVEFSKSISLNPTRVFCHTGGARASEVSSTGSQNSFSNCRYELVRIGEMILENPKSKIQVREAKENTTGAYPFYTSGTNIYRYDEALVSGENIYLSTGGNAIVQFYDGESAYSTDTYAIKTDSKKMLTKFLFYILQMQQSYINTFLFKGVGLKHLQKPAFKNLKIPLPPLEIQKQIVEECEKVEKEQSLITQSIESYNELIKAILVKTGIVTESNTANNIDSTIKGLLESLHNLESQLESTNINATKEYQALLDSIPTPPREGWEMKKLGQIANISRGASPRPINDFLTTEKDGINWIKIGDVAEGEKYITKTEQKITQAGAEKSKRVKTGDFILSNSMSAGRPYILKIDGCIHDGWLLLSQINHEINKEFLYYALLADDAQKQFEQKATGSVVKNLNTDLVAQVKIPLPPLESQEKIATAIEAIESKISFLQEQNKGVDSKKSGILQRFLES